MAPVVLAIPSVGMLHFNLDPVFAHHNTTLPDPWRLCYYGYYFIVGAWLSNDRCRLQALTRSWKVCLVLSLPVGLGMFGLLTEHFQIELTDWRRHGLVGLTALFAWLSIFGCLGFCLKRFTTEVSIVKYLADASYWIYLVHLPVVALAQLALYKMPLAPGLKFVLVVGTTLVLGGASYHALVRYTWVGSWLNGSQKRKACTGRSDSSEAFVAVRRPAA